MGGRVLSESDFDFWKGVSEDFLFFFRKGWIKKTSAGIFPDGRPTLTETRVKSLAPSFSMKSRGSYGP
jgi:hypothetical protein